MLRGTGGSTTPGSNISPLLSFTRRCSTINKAIVRLNTFLQFFHGILLFQNLLDLLLGDILSLGKIEANYWDRLNYSLQKCKLK
jgi:hypothetical protein